MKRTAILLGVIALAGSLLLSGCCALMHHRDGHGKGCGCEKKYDCAQNADCPQKADCPKAGQKDSDKPCCPEASKPAEPQK